jgi:hypothetical protein
VEEQLQNGERMSERHWHEPGEIGVAILIGAIESLPGDGRFNARSGTTATTKEQWLGWLSEYHVPGYYDRKGVGYDARFAYNHLSNPRMLLWLAEAAGIEGETVTVAAAAAEEGKTVMQKAAAVRKCIPWTRIANALWPEGFQARDSDA